MGFFSAVLLYVVLWWVILFAILPLWVNSAKAAGRGHDAGAPEDSFIKKKILITSLIAFICWLIIYALIDADIEWLNKLFMD